MTSTAPSLRALLRRLLAVGAVLTLAVSLVVGLGDTASATSTRTWTFSGVTFDDGGQLTGSFDLSDSGQMTAVSITTSGGDTGAYGTSTTYDASNSDGVGYLQVPGQYVVMVTDGSRYLMLQVGDLSAAAEGDVVALDAQSWECLNCSPYRYVSAGSIVAGPVHPAPIVTGTPTVTGTPQVGETLTGDDSTVTATPQGATKLDQWLRDGVPIPGATGGTYTLSAADAGHTIAFQVSASQAGNPDASPVTSAPVGPIGTGTAQQLAVIAPAGLHLAGRGVPVTTAGLEAGEPYVIEIAGVQVADGHAAGTGPLTRTVTVPAGTAEGATTITVTDSAARRTGAVSIQVVARKTLRLHLARRVMDPHHRQRVTVRGLVAGEHVRVAYRGKRISSRYARADAHGVYHAVIHVGWLAGTKTVTARGAFYARRARTTFVVESR